MDINKYSVPFIRKVLLVKEIPFSNFKTYKNENGEIDDFDFLNLSTSNRLLFANAQHSVTDLNNNIYEHNLSIVTMDQSLTKINNLENILIIFFNSKDNGYILRPQTFNFVGTLNETTNNVTLNFKEVSNSRVIKMETEFANYINKITS